jgi:hypothetical protein
MCIGHRKIAAGLIACGVMLGLEVPVQAKMTQWKDVQGASFRGEPTEILGPFVIFRTAGGGGRRIPARVFSPEECRLIQAEIAQCKPRGVSLAAATGIATSELPGNVLRVEHRTLVPAGLSQQPEPDLLLVLCGSHNDGEGWFMTSNLMPFYWRVRRVYPDLMEAVFLGARHDAAQHREIAINSGMPWLVADFQQQGAMSSFTRFLPREQGANAVLMTREGVPLAAAGAGDAAAVRAFFDQATDLLWLIDPANPVGWPDRLHYMNATRPAQFAQSHADPVLVGNPLRPEKLGGYGVKRVAARLEIAADGRVTPKLLSGPADVPTGLVPAVEMALNGAVIAPAIDHGQPVAGALDYVQEVPPVDVAREADRVWLASTRWPVLPITEWLVLRPIEVPEKEFLSTVVGQNESGTLVLSSMEVNDGKISRAAQMSAFSSDWFAAAGADSVRPREGDRQKIDDRLVLKWEKVRSVDGFVDMQTAFPKDYTVGYAWAEFESPAATEAWLGLGSDDGVKIWLNGELVHDRWIRRPSRVDDEVVPLRLRKGTNRILIKIQNVTGEWSFIYRLRLPPR